MSALPRAELRREALELLSGSRWATGSKDELRARDLLPQLKSGREFQLLADLSERLVRSYPRDPELRKQQTQALIEIGQATTAVEVARAGLRGLPHGHTEWSELTGLIGRAYKHIALDTREPDSKESVDSLKKSVRAYAKPFEKDPAQTWHSINLVAMLSYAERIGARMPIKLDPKELATSIIDRLKRLPKAKRDRWTAATLAEAYLALDQMGDVEKHIGEYLADPDVKAFEVGSTLRQFAEVWGLQESGDARHHGLLQAMQVGLMKLTGGQLNVPSADLNRQRLQSGPEPKQLEAILGTDGTQSFAWWKLGLERAVSVAAIHAGINKRFGTGFLVNAQDFGFGDGDGDGDQRLLMTNFHVVNRRGAGNGLRPGDAQVVFEAVDATKRYGMDEIVWESPVDKHDAVLVRLHDLPDNIAPIPVASNLPIVEATAKVYVIGHPGGGELEFSFQDNALIDHEGPPKGLPEIEGVCRLHYRAPTEKGSSGSPVFNAAYWEAIALHHAGGELSQLNRKEGIHLANEGISLLSIRQAIHASADGAQQ